MSAQNTDSVSASLFIKLEAQRTEFVQGEGVLQPDPCPLATRDPSLLPAACSPLTTGLTAPQCCVEAGKAPAATATAAAAAVLSRVSPASG